MRFARLLAIILFVCAPVSALALRVPFVGSPFAHMTVFSIGVISPVAEQSGQMAAVALPVGTKKEMCSGDGEQKTNISGGCYEGSKNICTSETVSFINPGAIIDVKTKCLCTDQQSFDKVGCGAGQQAGTVTYAGKVYSKCKGEDSKSIQQIQNICATFSKVGGTGGNQCSCIGDSLCVGMVKAGCNAGGAQIQAGDNNCNNNLDPSHLACGSRNPQQVLNQINNLTPEQVSQIKDGTIVLSPGCSNEAGICKACDPSNPDACIVKQQLDALNQKFAEQNLPPPNVQVMGVSDTHATACTDPPHCNFGYLDGVNNTVGQIVSGTDAHYLGPLQNVAANDGIHSNNYPGMLQEIDAPTVAASSISLGDTATTRLPGGQYGQMFRTAEDNASLADKGVPGILAKFATVESGGNPNICSSAGACGQFQYIPSTWAESSARINGGVPLDPSLRFDPETAAKVAANDVSYYLDKFGTQIDASGMDKSAAVYAIHNLGIGGGPAFIDAYTANPDAPVSSVVSAGAIKANKGIYGDGSITLAQAQQNMLSYMNGDSNFTRVASNGMGPTIAVSDLTATHRYIINDPSTDYAYKSSNNYNSAFGGMGGGLGMMGMMGGSSLGNLFGNLFKPSTTNTSQAQAAPPPPQPALTLNVQPQTLKRGDSITVSWSSSNASSCSVTENGLNIGQGIAGATTTPTATTTPAGSIIFRLLCYSSTNGQLVQQGSTALLQ